MEPKVVVRRARRRDLHTIIGLINSSRCRPKPMTELEAAKLLLRKGLWLAVCCNAAGLAGWQAENLVTCIDEMYVYPLSAAPRLLPPLLEAVEGAARELECEISAAIAPASVRAQMDPVIAGCGYTLRPVVEMDRVWREMLTQLLPDDETTAWVKQLRRERVLAPI